MQMLLSKCVSTLIALSLMISLTGCYEIEKIINKGTVKGVSLCIDHNTSSLLSEELVKRKCIKENQSELAYKWFESAADIYVTDIDSISMGHISIVSGINDYDEYVITELRVDIKVYDADGKLHIKQEVIETWIEPSKDLSGSSKIRKFDLPTNTNISEVQNKYCSDTLKISCRTWGVERISGVRI